MCGIAGIVTRAAIEPEQAELVARLNALLVHRGPDGEGRYDNAHVALAMRRLSIIDLAAGWQPLYNEDHSLALVANGEVYNFIELRKSLEARGHRFRTHSDCETILHLYEEHGDDCVHHLRGMYAFALWDTKKRRLLLCRDRMGEKPLYLAEFADRIVFASELKALIGAGVVPFELDPAAVHLYFHYGYVPEPQVPVRGVRKLPAGHILTIEVDPWRVQERCYWRMEDAPPIEADPVKTIREELDRVGELIIRSDVPVGVALSGGMDSSAIAALAASKYPGTMHAFSVGYPGRPVQDERNDAKALADHLGMPFHEIELSTEDVVRDYASMVYFRDDPIGDISGSSYFAVMRLAREHNVPVMLMGQGGDELFWGYPWVRAALQATRRRQALHGNGGVRMRDYLQLSKPPKSYNGMLRWMRSLGGVRSSWQQYREDRVAPADRMVFYDLEPAYQEVSGEMRSIYAGAFAQRVSDVDPRSLFTLAQPWPPLSIAITRLISQTYLLENGIAQGDRLSMAHSVELRLPLVDYRLVETVIGLRKVRDDSTDQPKRWLREAVRDVVPAFVMNRAKRGFTPPWRAWLRALADAFGDDLIDGYLVQHGVLDPRAARRMRRKLSPRVAAPYQVAGYATALEAWCRQMHACARTSQPATSPVHSGQRAEGN